MISGPRNSRPTLRGWINKTTGQLVKQEVITKEQIDEWDAANTAKPTTDIVDPLGLTVVEETPVEEIDDGLEDVDLPDDLGLQKLNEDRLDAMAEMAKARKAAGEAQLRRMRATGELDFYKNIIAKTNRKK